LVPLYLLLFHYHPRDKGLTAYGADESAEDTNDRMKASDPNESVPASWSMSDATKTHQLWLLVLSQFLYWGIGCYLILAHQVKFAVDVGFSNLFAASIFGLFGVFMIVGQLSSSISDWIGRELTVAISSVFCVVALAALLSINDTSRPWLLYVYAICFGFGAGLFSPTVFVGAADIFHGPHFGSISGLMLMGMGMGGAIGPWLGGYLYDTTGSYVSAFVLCLMCFVLAGVAFIIAAPRHAAQVRARRARVAA
jgi:fucose permease